MRRGLPSLLLLAATAVLLAAQVRRVPTEDPVQGALPAGPAALTAGSSVPGQVWLTFSSVPNAHGYRVTRLSATAPEQTIHEGEAGQFLDGPTGVYHDAPVSPAESYSYRVYAVFTSPTGTTVSAPSPAASVVSARFKHPAGLKYSVQSSPASGMTDLLLTWGAVPNVQKYRVTVEGRSMPYETSSTSLVISGVPVGRTYRVCVGTVYPYNISRDASAPCITAKT